MRRNVLIGAGTLVMLLGLILLLVNLGGGGEPGDPPAAAPSTSPATTSTAEPPELAPTTAEPSTTSTPTPTSTPPSSEAWLPAAGAEAISVRVDSAAIDHTLIPQGLSSDGTINPAKNEVIWFTGYDRVPPGQVGTSVIAGHVTYSDVPDAFINLSSVTSGDTVSIGYADGSTLTADVVSTALVPKEELSHDPMVWGANSEKRRIVLITCDDALGDRSDGHHIANFVVVAEVTDTR